MFPFLLSFMCMFLHFHQNIVLLVYSRFTGSAYVYYVSFRNVIETSESTRKEIPTQLGEFTFSSCSIQKLLGLWTCVLHRAVCTIPNGLCPWKLNFCSANEGLDSS